MVKIIAVQIGNDRVIALRENGPHNWRVYVDTKSYEVDDATLVVSIGDGCGLQIETVVL